MKSLFIDNKRVIMEDDTYFPFTHTITDLENVDIIGLPSTKTVTIPRCPNNDEIFGYIADITRINYGTSDNKVGISFNQIKQCEYTLSDESILISKGLVIIDNITETSYEITLYDYLIKKLEELEGDAETGEYYLTELDITKNSTPVSFQSNAANIKNRTINLDMPIIPVACIRDNNNDLDKKSIRCTTVNGSTTKIDKVDLPIECTSLQLKTLKSYEFNYATTLNTTVDAINAKYGNIIGIDPSVQSIFNDTYMLLNNPKNEEKAVNKATTLKAYSTTIDSLSYQLTDNFTNQNACIENGHKRFDIDLEIKWESSITDILGGCLKDGESVWSPKYMITAPDGTIFSKIWLKVWFTNQRKSSSPLYYAVDLVKGVNCQLTMSGEYLKFLTLTYKLNIDQDLYINFGEVTYTQLHLDILHYDPNNPAYKWQLFGGNSNIIYTTRTFKNTSILTESNLAFRSNDTINTKKIMPKISIKDFILQVVKFFNLDITTKDNLLYIQKKKYYVSTDNILVDTIDGISTNNITFNRLRLINSLPKSDLLDNYKTQYKSTYASKTINTGYSIKKSTKDITLEASIPVLLRDYNSFAYHSYGGYYNGGYSKNTHGMVNDLDGKLTFCYVKKVSETLYVTDDTPFEGGLNEDSILSNETKFLHYNPALYVNTALGDGDVNKYLFKNLVDISYGFSTLPYYYSVTPYYFTDGIISKSLELEKPNINYAGITDNQYPEQSTLYYRYHRNMLIDKYNSNTHILSVKMYIDGLIDIYKIYNYHNSFYIVSDITEYDPTKPDIYEIKLMRVNDPNNYINNITL